MENYNQKILNNLFDLFNGCIDKIQLEFKFKNIKKKINNN